jgi:pyruvate/2-oxoglutarate dehydrogenase complex dihydrolipoamide dehydrogenase (E3) component
LTLTGLSKVAGSESLGARRELARIIHPHPTISEAAPEAARRIDDWAIHA